MNQNPEGLTFNPKTRDDWRVWLSKNHSFSSGVWLRIRKKKSEQAGLLLAEAVEEALCFGWIDSKLKPEDKNFYRLHFTPRKTGSTWSRANKELVEKLTAEGKMTATGLAKVSAAKKDGSWNRLTDIDELRIPEEFSQSLSTNPVANNHFQSLSDSTKKQVLWWIASAKTPKTREKRIAQATEKLQSNKQNPFA